MPTTHIYRIETKVGISNTEFVLPTYGYPCSQGNDLIALLLQLASQISFSFFKQTNLEGLRLQRLTAILRLQFKKQK